MTPATPAPPPPAFGVYVHFPWCLKKCPYCDFLSVAAERPAIPHERYADAVLAELEARASTPQEGVLRSIFFGGGTPSLWSPASLGRVLERILKCFGTGDDPVEVTVECNPTSLDADRARSLVDAGVNRLSVGVQGLDEDRLKFLGRLHDPDGALAAVEVALASGAERVSCDLIFGIAGQTAAAAADDADRIAALGVTHLSAYALTIEPNTQFGARARQGRLPLLPDDAVADSFLAVDRRLAARGFEHYEISNYAIGDDRAEHNLGYWHGDDYLGLGCGAWGTVEHAGEHLRYLNTRSPERYLEWADAPADPWQGNPRVSEVESLSPETRLSERIMLGLRLDGGLNVDAAAAEVGAAPWPEERTAAVRDLVERGRMIRSGPRLSIPKEQWLLADDAIARVM